MFYEKTEEYRAHTIPQENLVLSWVVVVLHNTEEVPLLEVALDNYLHRILYTDEVIIKQKMGINSTNIQNGCPRI